MKRPCRRGQCVVVAAVLCCLVWTGCGGRGTPTSAEPVPASPLVTTAIRAFEYSGIPIHPRLVERFSGWLADDAPPVVVAVDVSAAAKARNEYHVDGVQADDDKGVWYAKSETEQFGYKHVGSMANGTCVLVTWEWGGGSGVFADLLLLKFQEQRKNGHLLMYVVGRHALGGRGSENVTVHADRVDVAAAKTKDGEWPRLVIRADECEGALDF